MTDAIVNLHLAEEVKTSNLIPIVSLKCKYCGKALTNPESSFYMGWAFCSWCYTNNIGLKQETIEEKQTLTAKYVCLNPLPPQSQKVIPSRITDFCKNVDRGLTQIDLPPLTPSDSSSNDVLNDKKAFLKFMEGDNF